MEVRQPTRVVAGQKVTDGGGVRLHRVLGTQELEDLDPFLLLDEFRSDDPGRHGAGFPDHPHRGIETVTYLLVGAIRHGDSEGNSGRLTPGDVQWMTAGRGIVHSEMPERSGLIWGFQLWVNLSARDKMTEPRYREIKAAQIPTVVGPGGAAVKVIAGEMDGVAGAVSGVAVDPIFFDVSLPAGGRFAHGVPAGHEAFAYVFDGAMTVGEGDRRLPVGAILIGGVGDRRQCRRRSAGANTATQHRILRGSNERPGNGARSPCRDLIVVRTF